MSFQFSGRGALVVSILLLSSVAQTEAAKVPRAVLKEYFQSGDKPTEKQFSTLLDSTVNFVDDRYLLGLKVYDPQLIYVAGDTVIFNRLVGGEILPSSAGGLQFAPASELTGPGAPTLDMLTDFAGQSGFLGIQLQDSAGIYNGYLQLHMDAPSGLPNDPPAIHVDYIVYEDVPGAPIEVTLVPEPTTIGLAMLIATPLARRRRRA